MTLKSLIVFALGAGLLAACGKSDPAGDAEKLDGPSLTMNDPATGEKVTVKTDEDKSVVSVTTKDGTAVVATGDSAAAAVPDLPAYAPLYPGAAVQQTIKGTGASGDGGMITLKTADAPDKVIAYYREQFTKHGLTVNAEATMGAMHMIAGQAKDGKGGAQVMATADKSGDTMIQLVTGMQD